MIDKNGIKIIKGATVDVPAPRDADDGYNNEFRGTVTGTHGDYVIVEDQEENSICIEPERIEVVDEELEAQENQEAIKKFLKK